MILIVQRFLGTFNNERCLYLYYVDNDTGDSRRRKFPLRSLKKKSNTEMVRDLVSRYPDYLENINPVQIERMIETVRQNLGDSVVIGDENLNKVSDGRLEYVKNKMDVSFKKNQVPKDSPEFKYDIRVEFPPASDKNEWDSISSSSKSSQQSSKQIWQGEEVCKEDLVVSEVSPAPVAKKPLPALMPMTSPLATMNAAFRQQEFIGDQNESDLGLRAEVHAGSVSDDPLDDFDGDIDDVLNMLDEDDSKKVTVHPTIVSASAPAASSNVLLPSSWVSETLKSESKTNWTPASGSAKKLAPLQSLKVVPPTVSTLAPLVSPTTPQSPSPLTILPAEKGPITTAAPGTLEMTRLSQDQNLEVEEQIEECIYEEVASLSSAGEKDMYVRKRSGHLDDAPLSDVEKGDTASTRSSLHSVHGDLKQAPSQGGGEQEESDIVFSDDDLGDF